LQHVHYEAVKQVLKSRMLRVHRNSCFSDWPEWVDE